MSAADYDIVDIRLESAPALGDVRMLPAGSWVWVFPNARDRQDWPRYLDALRHAVGRGVNVRWP